MADLTVEQAEMHAYAACLPDAERTRWVMSLSSTQRAIYNWGDGYAPIATPRPSAEVDDAFAALACANTREQAAYAEAQVIAAVRAETLTQLQAAIQAKFTPALNTGTAMDALVLVGEAIRELEGVPRG